MFLTFLCHNILVSSAKYIVTTARGALTGKGVEVRRLGILPLV